MGHIFNAPLVESSRTGKNKILWYVRQLRDGSRSASPATPPGRTTPR